jgi:hypothetical protein
MKRQLGGVFSPNPMNDIVKVFNYLVVLGVFCLFIFFAVQLGKKAGFENSVSKNNSMFLFADNKSSPSCCNFSYSSSNGCVCIDKEQQLFLHTRGGNRTIDADF